MKYVLDFKKISKKDVNLAGGKGASLGEMTKAAVPVPPGFVLLATAFDRFLEETDLLQQIDAELKKINYKDTNSVGKASAIIRDMITKVSFPKDLEGEILKSFKSLKSKYVAVRSSATAEDSKVASWAGELETYLNTTEKNLIANVKKCWSSLFTPRAIFYRREKNLHRSKVSVAVVVQKMVQSEISGITFTVHPVTEDPNQMIVEAGLGLGEYVVSGMITPDSYVIEKKRKVIIDINVAEQKIMLVKSAKGNKQVKLKEKVGGKQKLTGPQILKIAEICMGVERRYKFPCDIEWAYEKGRFYVTQSRPITTLQMTRK